MLRLVLNHPSYSHLRLVRGCGYQRPHTHCLANFVLRFRHFLVLKVDLGNIYKRFAVLVRTDELFHNLAHVAVIFLQERLGV